MVPPACWDWYPDDDAPAGAPDDRAMMPDVHTASDDRITPIRFMDLRRDMRFSLMTLLRLLLPLYYKICYLTITRSNVVIRQEPLDDVEVAIGLLDERHVAGILKYLPAHVRNVVEERLHGGRRH